jgi:hypothetical protein
LNWFRVTITRCSFLMAISDIVPSTFFILNPNPDGFGVSQTFPRNLPLATNSPDPAFRTFCFKS